nr:unnamed protein product [Callosobruchus chinensis]
MAAKNDKIARIKEQLKSYADFPKKGILFWDIFSILQKPSYFQMLKDALVEEAKRISPPIECIAGLEARGFLFGPLISLELNVPFVPIRKKGKLPGNLTSVCYSKEYGPMVRNYIRKKSKEPRYSEENLNRSLEEIGTGRLTVHKASILYGVPFTTLYGRVRGTRGAIKKTRGSSIALGESIEDFLAVSIKTLAKLGFGLSRKEILELVGNFVCKNDITTPFKNGLPGEDWFLNFKKRHN